MITRAQIHPAHCACSRCHPRHPAEPRLAAAIVGQLLRAVRLAHSNRPR